MYSDGQGSALGMQDAPGAVDTRAVHALQPVITLSDLHKKLVVSSIKEQQPDKQLLFSAAATKLGEAAKQAALTAGIDFSRNSNADVPEGLTADTWAELQKTAKELDVRGIFDPQVNQLRSKMLQQVKLYKAMQAKQQRATAAKAGFGSLAGKQASMATNSQQSDTASLAGRLEASCQHVIASLPDKPTKPQHTAASVMSGTSSRTQQTTRTNRTGRRTTQQQTMPLPGQGEYPAEQYSQQQPGAQQHPVLQQQRARSPGPTADEPQGLGLGLNQNPSPASPRTSALAAAALAGLSARTSSTAEAIAAWQQQNDDLAQATANGFVNCSCSAPNTQRQQQMPLTHRSGCAYAASGGGSGTGSAVQTHRSIKQQQKQTIETIKEENVQEESVRGTTSKHLFSVNRTMPRKQDKTLAECVAAIAAEDRPSSPTDQAAQSAAAAIQKRLSPAACEAFQAAVATAVDSKLKLYRDRAQQARQEMLQRELAGSTGQQQPQAGQQEQADAAAVAAAPPQAVAAGSQAGSATGGAAAAAAGDATVDAALLTMQQLVALLVKKDVTPEVPEDASQAHKVAAEQAAKELQQKQQEVTATAAASQKLAAARSVAEMIAAANEHVAAAAHEFDDPLDVNKVAAVRRMGKDWQKRFTEASSNPASTTASSTSDSAAANTARRYSSTAEDSHAQQQQSRSTSTVVQQQQRSSVTDASEGVAGVSRMSRAGSAGTGAAVAGGRAPAGMRLQAPKLQGPTEQELAALPMPSLPALLDLSHEPAKVLQARLERVWGVLGVNADQQMDMVLRYTSRAAACHFEAALETWETAAAAYLQREGLLQQLMQLRAAMQQHKQQQMVGAKTRRGSQDTAPNLLLGLDFSQIHQLLWAFIAATEQVKIAAQFLLETSGQQLTVKGSVYPPAGAVSSASQLQPMLDEVWNLLGCGRM